MLGSASIDIPETREKRLRVHEVATWPEICDSWSELAKAAGSSVFLSPEWMGLWLESFGPGLRVRLLRFDDGTTTVGVLTLCKSISGLRLSPLRRLSLNASGEPAADTTYVEYNDVVCLPGWHTAIATSLIDYISELQWDEFSLDGFVDGPFKNAIDKAMCHLDCEQIVHPSYYVNLAEIRAKGQTFEQVMKRSQRKHLRQNIRYYGELGPLEVKVAQDVSEALQMLEEMAALSQARSAAVGRRGIFSSENFYSFHRAMVSRYLLQGLVQLMRVAAGGQTVGILYNLVHQGRVYFYQCGYNYTEDKRLSPGTVTLYFAIQRFLEDGYDDYDFLSGESKYKEWMSTGARTLSWSVFRRKSVRSGIFVGLRKLRRTLIARQDG